MRRGVQGRSTKSKDETIGRFADYLWFAAQCAFKRLNKLGLSDSGFKERDAHQQIDSDLQSVLKSPSLKYCQRHNGPKG